MAIGTVVVDVVAAQEALQRGKQAHQQGRVSAAEDYYVDVLASLGMELPAALLPSGSGTATSLPFSVVVSAEAADALHLLGAARAQRLLCRNRNGGGPGEVEDEEEEEEEEAVVSSSKGHDAENAELNAALCLLRAALSAEPHGDKPTRRARLRNSLGAALLQSRDAVAAQEAAGLFRMSIEMDSTCWSARQNLLKALGVLKNEAASIGDKAAQTALATEKVGLLRTMAEERPDHPFIFYKLGMSLRNLGGHDVEAASSLEKHLEVTQRRSDLEVRSGTSRDGLKVATAQHWLAVLRGESSATAPPAYVASLFDSYAEKFEDHLVEKLGYQTPQLIEVELQALARELPANAFGRCADLGCGTGLMGPPLRSIGVRELEGVDLSERMLCKAQGKGVRGVGYDRLVCGDLLAIFRPRASPSLVDMRDVIPPIEHLELHQDRVLDPESTADCFDLVVAADVFVYIGDLRPAVSASARWLSPRGLLVFSTESSQGPGCGTESAEVDSQGFALTPTGRYVHSDSYVHCLAESCGFELVVRRAVTLRYNAGKPVRGHIYVLRLKDGQA
eukprot:TRINITY_DN9804_c0_g1_i1.p1 TRINITY_DN9804_c0_g1~~TRINITY_DN9804_c0_g1_i1.p1  ORF type:complete len:562 (+),score=93.03 TRINITY_DN9804_c0_g1_i1:156-1841(+)